ncbi:unnamed protein product (macronuclear) [Paramecium tetraurelia]|uniref:S-adenosyl-L-homocysteine hydrolase NAD binding domain-containing protein n=1 Tax=Paramecium tetraurelia TaxID=5888 RepID=A0DP58_PARTE|nr:uncharacterized protein GSPATT00019007001 [Paramecium tetraurelia]CAK84825.1 unnamed protein product [Paramecium tetraurelia]|eukprot:XP_001452222.1 hypothetical protein (macronuclear) [Paramecium tetraurelia strain d4-2]
MDSEDYKVKDITQDDFGRKELNLAEVEMPGLIAFREEYGPEQILKGARISGSLHMTVQTAVQLKHSTLQGLKQAQDHAAAAIAQAKTAAVFAQKAQSLLEYWDCIMSALDLGNVEGPTLIVEDGGDMAMILEGFIWEKRQEANGELPEPEKGESKDEQALLKVLRKEIQQSPNKFRNYIGHLIGVSEETTTGVHRLKQIAQKESQYSQPQVLMIRLLNRNLITFMDVDIQLQMESSEQQMLCYQERKHQFVDLEMQEKDVLKHSKDKVVEFIHLIIIIHIDSFQYFNYLLKIIKNKYFYYCYGNKEIINPLHMSQMKHNAIVGKIGHFDVEIDMKVLRQWEGIKKVEVKPLCD